MPEPKTTVAIVGAGLGGLCCARGLQQAGLKVRIFDKGRGAGGRLSVRRADRSLAFDHGAQYFTVKDQAMSAQVQLWLSAGVIARWQARIGSIENGHWKPTESSTTRYVGVPGMSSIAKNLAGGLDLVTRCPVTSLSKCNGVWELRGAEGTDLGSYDILILNAPAPQSAALVERWPTFANRIGAVEMAPCWSVCLAFEERLDVAWDAAFVNDSPLSWVARNSSKPGRDPNPDCWVLHGNPDWSAAHLENSEEQVIDELSSSLREVIGMVPPSSLFSSAHRWRYALPTRTLEDRYVYDADLRLGACGDWCGGPRVEGAYLSGLALSAAIALS